MRPTTVVSSANLMKRLELCDGVQSWVSRVKRRGLSTHPWGAPVFSVMVLDVLLPTRTAWGLPVRKSNSQLHSDVLSPAVPVYGWAVEEWLCWMLNWSLWTAIWHTCPFCLGVWGLGGGQWRWHHRSSDWTYMQTGRGPGRGGRTDLMCCMTNRSKHFMRIGVSATGR